jgi:light-regulated signal transduction histidine kinase (bacteriophytochrome)
VIAADITERKKSEERLAKQALDLERSNQELERFAYVASHDLQEPLRKIQAFGGRLRKYCEQQIDAQSLDYLERMQSAAARMQVLITDLLTLSRITSRAQPFVKVNTNQLVQDVLVDLEVRIKDVQGSVEVGPLPALIADPTQIRQLMQNLVANALKFHKKNEPSVVKVYAQGISDGQPADGQFDLVVEDNGIGFEQQYAERIFQIFQRLHGRSEYEGTGVGLAVCRKIVERHGGTIRAYGEPGQGARFVATFPAEVADGSDSALRKNQWDCEPVGTGVPTTAKVDA